VLLLVSVPVALLLAACGQENVPASDVNNGVYITAGPITYQLQVSRELNQYATEDSQYLIGLPPGTAQLAPDQVWYGVFLWAKNQSDTRQPMTGNFDIVDTQGNIYRPIALNTAINGYAYKPTFLTPGATAPGPDTTASFGPTGGELLLFKLNTTVYSNRPLILEIRSSAGTRWGRIFLDL
jgi:hypothetical protein